MLGAVLQGCIKDEAHLQLHSFPSPSVKTGSFVHDIYLREPSWTPNNEEMRAISAEMIKMAAKNLKIERLEVSYDLALEMFKENPYKKEQLPFIKGSTRSGKFAWTLFINGRENTILFDEGPSEKSILFLIVSQTLNSEFHLFTIGVRHKYSRFERFDILQKNTVQFY